MKLGLKKTPAPESKTVLPGSSAAATTIITLALLFTIASAQAGWLTIGPDYKTPTNSVPANYKAVDFGSWKQGAPLDHVPKGNWWEIYADTNLNALETQAVQTNQQLRAAIARVDQARATARIARSQLMPNLSLDPSFSRQGYSPNADPSFGNITANTFSAPVDLSYEVDLWGRIRRLFQGARADAQASLADYYNVLLTLQSDVAAELFRHPLIGCGDRHGQRHD
ncbi:MAG: TolC family protein [Limisphaerales bacterium]